jgi:glycosyltransferase involved in cell wall biosynthesis
VERATVLTTRPKVCYVLPKYDPKSYTHFSYLDEFIKEIGKEYDVFLIIEKGPRPQESWGWKHIRVGGYSGGIVRLGKLKINILEAHLRGYKTFYIHYSFLAAFTASFIAKALGGKIFYWNCGLPWKYKKNIFRRAFERTTYKLISHLVTGTKGMADQYAAQYAIARSKIKVMPNWINVAKFQNTSHKKRNGQEKIILFVHRLSRRKGAHHLPVIARIAKEQDAKLIIVGDGPEKKHIEAQMKKDGTEHNVEFTGWKPQSEVVNYFAHADVFILPSEEEGFPHVMLETFAVGIPFVAYDVGGVREITPKELQDFIVPQGHESEFNEKIKKALTFSEEKREIIQSTEREWVKKYDIKNILVRFRETITA